MSQKMTSAPVYFTIAQVKFNPLFALDSYAPKIQESFRKTGYPDVQKSLLATFNLNVGAVGESNPQVPVGQTARYVFSDIQKSAGFILEQAALSYQVTEYDVFEVFSENLLKGIELIDQIVGGLSFCDRVGVRYLDAIYPKNNEKLSDYLDTAVLGLVGKLQGELGYSFSETLTLTSVANIISRVIVQKGPVAFPPDLQPMFFNLPERFKKLDGLHATIDTDGSFSIREKFDLEVVKRHLFEIHDEIEKSFKATVTDHALNVWK
jgi:uncharacterized protein (TIGR04255 family)